MVWLLQTKAAILGFFAFFFIFLVGVVKYQKKIIDKRLIRAISVLTFTLLLLAVVITILKKDKFSRIFDQNSSFERLALWKNSENMIKENFLLGVGAGNWQINFPKYGLGKFQVEEVKMGLTTFQRPHNDFLWVFCEMGFVGLLIYLSIFITIVYQLIQLFRKYKEQEISWLYLILLATCIGYIIIAFFDFPFERVEHQILLFVIFSIASAHYYHNFYAIKAHKNIALKFPIIVIMLFIPVCFSFSVSSMRCSGEFHSQKMYLYKNIGNWDLLINEANKATNSCYSIDPMSIPIDWYKGVAFFSKGNSIVAQKYFEQAYLIAPFNIHVLNNLASCYESLKKHDKAEKLYVKALFISPQFDEARLNLSAVYYNEGKFDKAFETIDLCNINSTDEKYKQFLPSILNSWVNQLLKKQKDKQLINHLNCILATKNKVMDLYLASKAKRVKFEPYIFNNQDD
ncbi:MAG: O-antigen ligase family protein [Bacteroidetes bacterium]|nr:O-antigen ligase family protein [Bacteroidota bacterium]